MWVRDAGCNGFGRGSGSHELEEVGGRAFVVFAHPLELTQTSFDVLVDDKVNHRLRDAIVRGRYTLVEALDTLGLVHLADTIPGCQATVTSVNTERQRVKTESLYPS